MANKKAKTTKKKNNTSKKSVANKSKATKVTKVTASKKPMSKFKRVVKSDSMKVFGLETVGTFALVAAFMLTKGNLIVMFFVATAIIFGLGLYQGGYLNPLLSFGAWITKRISAKKMILHIIAQIFGSALAFLLVLWFINAAPQVSPQMAAYGAQAPTMLKLSPVVEGKEWLILVAELIGASLLSFFVARPKDKTNLSVKALTYGGAILVALLLASSLSETVGGGIAIANPALALALQIFPNEAWNWMLAVYIIAPLVGGTIGFLLADVTTTKKN